MNEEMEAEYDDGSIVVVNHESCHEDYVISPSFAVFPIAGMTESQQLSDSTHKQIQDILKENNELRDSLHKNNTEMRQLLVTFRDYQDKTLQSRALHKEKLNTIWKENKEIQDERTKVKKENNDLQNQLKFKDEDLSKLQSELSLALGKCSDFENQLATVKEDLKRSELSVLTLTNQVKELESEITAQKFEREKLQNQIEALMEQLDRQNSAFQEKLTDAEHRYTDSENKVLTIREDLKEARSKVETLKTEAQKLSSQNEVLQKQLGEQNTAFAEGISSAQQRCRDLENELSLLKQNVLDRETSELQAKGLLEETQKGKAELEEKITFLEEEKNKFLELLKGLNRGMVPEEDDMGFSFVCSQQPSSSPASEAVNFVQQNPLQEEEINKLNMTIIEQKKQLEKYEKELAELQAPASIQQAESADRFFHVQNLSKLKSASSLFQCYEERYESIGQELGACHERLQYLKLEEDSRALMEGLKHEVDVLRELLTQEKLEKNNLEGRIEQLTQNYRQVLASWEIYESEQTTKGRQKEALSTIERRQHQEKLDELMAQNFSLEEQVQVKDSDLSTLKRQIALLNREGEQIPILRAQVELYKQDFEKERTEKATAVARGDNLQLDVNTLHAQVTELRDELGSLQQQQRQDLNSSQELQRQGASAPPDHHLQEDDEPQPIAEFRMPRSNKTRIMPFRPRDAEDSG